MKYPVKSLVFASFFMLVCLSAFAEQQPMTKTPRPGGMPGMEQKCQMGTGMGMMNMSDEHMRAMQEDMLKMHDLMNRINATTDPEEKTRLKEEHLEMMKAHHAKMMKHRESMMHRGMKMNQPSGEKSQ